MPRDALHLPPCPLLGAPGRGVPRRSEPAGDPQGARGPGRKPGNGGRGGAGGRREGCDERRAQAVGERARLGWRRFERGAGEDRTSEGAAPGGERAAGAVYVVSGAGRKDVPEDGPGADGEADAGPADGEEGIEEPGRGGSGGGRRPASGRGHDGGGPGREGRSEAGRWSRPSQREPGAGARRDGRPSAGARENGIQTGTP